MALQISFCEAQIRTFEVDSESSDLSFSVSHLGFLTVDGNFEEFTGKCAFLSDTIVSLEGRINVGSIETGDKTRDQSLKSDAYLDSASYPLITFVSTEIQYSNRPVVIGKLKIKDQERIIQLPLEYSFSEDKRSCFIKTSTTINRNDFLLDFGAMDALIGDEILVKLGFNLELRP